MGQTPVIQFHFNWKQLSVIAGLTFTHCVFRLHEGAIRSPQIVEFLRALRRHLKRRLLIVWDGLRAHRSRLVRDYVDSTRGGLQLAFLPPYAPELNPVEYLWAWLKRHALANFCPDGFGELKTTARARLKIGPAATVHRRRVLGPGRPVRVSRGYVILNRSTESDFAVPVTRSSSWGALRLSLSGWRALARRPPWL